MSTLSEKKWLPSSENINSFSHLMEVLLCERSLHSPEEISHFLSPSLTDLHDPFDMQDMETVCRRIEQARKKQERVMIFGDFDADGITSTVILTDALKRFGLLVSYRIPDRNRDSHGLKNYLLDEIAEKKVSLVITCDCAINDAKEVQYAREKYSLDVIVTDHHDPDPEKYPKDAVGVLNPKKAHCDYPEKELSGAGVAFKLITALASIIFEKNTEKIAKFLEPYLEIVAIGLVADCVPLQGENRILVKYGLERLKNSSWDGLVKLLERNQVAPENINTDTIGFCIAPRLNAASRMGDVIRASQLFLGDRAQTFERLSYLERLNKERQIATEKHTQEAHAQWNPEKKFQIFLEKNWKPGILGLIGSRFVEKYDQPIIAGKIREDGFIAASCRAPEGYSIVEALRSCGENFFEQMGGHAGAAGFLIKEEKLSVLQEKLDQYFEKTEREKQPQKFVGFIDPEWISFSLTEFLYQISPFGRGNEEPIFGLKSIEIKETTLIGKNRNHLRITGEGGRKKIELAAFFRGDWVDRFQINQPYDILCKIQENTWRGQKRLQFFLVDAMPSTIPE